MRNGTPSAQVGEYMKKFYTIGETAALLGVSTDTLRYYDRIGLLKPARVDAESKYRYYSYTQFHYIDRIKYLQKLGMSLNEIRRVIHTGRVDKLIRYLKAEKIRLEKELTRVQLRIEDTDWYIIYFTYMDNQPGESIRTPGMRCSCLPARRGRPWMRRRRRTADEHGEARAAGSAKKPNEHQRGGEGFPRLHRASFSYFRGGRIRT